MAVSDVVSLKLDHSLVLAYLLVSQRNVNAMIVPDVGSVWSESLSIDCERLDEFALVIDEKAL